MATEEALQANEKICGNKQILKLKHANIGTRECVL